MEASVGLISDLQRLNDALNELLRPQTADGPDGAVVLASLLAQLEEAAEPSGGLGSGRANVYKSPAALDVLGLLSEIDRAIARSLRLANYSRRLEQPRSDLLRALEACAAELRARHPQQLRVLVDQAQQWHLRATNILTPDPQTIETRAQPCPVCKKRTAFVWSDDLGEKVQRPSLYLDKDTMTVHCRCCHSNWGPRMWQFLRRLLDGDRTSTQTDHSAR